MPQCAVANCTNNHRKTRQNSASVTFTNTTVANTNPTNPITDAIVRYHRFPSAPLARLLWTRACGRRGAGPAVGSARVCSRHFDASAYERDVQHELLGLPSRCRLRKGAVPTRELPWRPPATPPDGGAGGRGDDHVGNGGGERWSGGRDDAYAVLYAVGLVRRGEEDGDTRRLEKSGGGVPEE